MTLSVCPHLIFTAYTCSRALCSFPVLHRAAPRRASPSIMITAIYLDLVGHYFCGAAVPRDGLVRVWSAFQRSS